MEIFNKILHNKITNNRNNLTSFYIGVGACLTLYTFNLLLSSHSLIDFLFFIFNLICLVINYRGLSDYY